MLSPESQNHVKNTSPIFAIKPIFYLAQAAQIGPNIYPRYMFQYSITILKQKLLLTKFSNLEAFIANSECLLIRGFEVFLISAKPTIQCCWKFFFTNWTLMRQPGPPLYKTVFQAYWSLHIKLCDLLDYVHISHARKQSKLFESLLSFRFVEIRNVNALLKILIVHDKFYSRR